MNTKIKPQQFVRKPLYVDVVRITDDNIYDVAKWCKGEVRIPSESSPRCGGPYIKVRVPNPANERQTMAFPGDFVVRSGKMHKVYTEKAFTRTFDPVLAGHNESENLDAPVAFHPAPLRPTFIDAAQNGAKVS